MFRKATILLICLGFAGVLGGCATTSQVSLADRFVAFGLSAERSDCLAGELVDRLESDDVNAVVEFMDGLNSAGSAGETLDALLSIDNPAAASAIARAGISCAF